MVDPVRIFVGYDPREAVAYHVCCESILRRATIPVTFTPLALNTLPYSEGHGDGSNAFIYSRFLVPWLCNYRGHALYLDCDMVAQADIAELWRLRDPLVGVQVVKHDYRTKFPQKYFGNPNADYPRKNWSSLILWNCDHYPNRVLTPEYVREHDGAHLHRFNWLSDERIGSLPTVWNWLVGEYPHNDGARMLHYTIGTPCIKDYADCDHAADWYTELTSALRVGGQLPVQLWSQALGVPC